MGIYTNAARGTAGYSGARWSADSFANDQYATAHYSGASPYAYIRIRVVGTTLYADTSTNGTTWTNRATATGQNDLTSGYAGLVGDTVGSTNAFPAVRIQSGAQSYYWAELNGNWVYLHKVIAGVNTQLASWYHGADIDIDPGSADDWTGGDL